MEAFGRGVVDPHLRGSAAWWPVVVELHGEGALLLDPLHVKLLDDALVHLALDGGGAVPLVQPVAARQLAHGVVGHGEAQGAHLAVGGGGARVGLTQAVQMHVCDDVRLLCVELEEGDDGVDAAREAALEEVAQLGADEGVERVVQVVEGHFAAPVGLDGFVVARVEGGDVGVEAVRREQPYRLGAADLPRRAPAPTPAATPTASPTAGVVASPGGERRRERPCLLVREGAFVEDVVKPFPRLHAAVVELVQQHHAAAARLLGDEVRQLGADRRPHVAHA